MWYGYRLSPVNICSIYITRDCKDNLCLGVDTLKK